MTGRGLSTEVSWACVEPARGTYDDAELQRLRAHIAAPDSERRIVLHSGALPDWVIARDGWLAEDVLASWGTFVDRVIRSLGHEVAVWVTFDSPLTEAAWYGRDQRRVARVLLDAHAMAYLAIHHGPGSGGRSTRVGIRERSDGSRRFRWTAKALVATLQTGRIRMPFGLVGELPNGTPALDFVEWKTGE